MNDTLYIVVFRANESRPWLALTDPFTSRHLAEARIESERETWPNMLFAILEGPITSPEQMESAEAAIEVV